MAWTWEEILTDALSLSGILGEGQVVDPTMLESARVRASKLLDELDGEGMALPVFSTDIEFDTVSGQTRYVLGTGTDASPASAIRPEQILNMELQIQPGSQPVWIPMSRLSFMDYRDYISVPQNQSQPINYTWNPGWPQGDLYLWPAPNQVWRMRTTCTLKWIDVVGNPSNDWYANAELPSGFTNAFTDMLAYKLAQWRRLSDSAGDLKSKYTSAKYLMTTYSFNKVPRLNTQPSSFPWNINRAGMNP
jgi:hypothetical protein